MNSYELYISLQGKYFVGYTDELVFGKEKSACAGLFNPTNSGGSFVILLSDPETPDQPASVTVNFAWFEE
jgi:hypothetical protein